MTDAKRLMADGRRDLWRECVETHAQEDWGTTCDACLYLPEVYAQLESVEARLPDYLAAVEALEQTTAWIEQECWPEADYVGQGHNWSMSEDKREMGLTLLEQARAALARLRDEVPA